MDSIPAVCNETTGAVSLSGSRHLTIWRGSSVRCQRGSFSRRIGLPGKAGNGTIKGQGRRQAEVTVVLPSRAAARSSLIPSESHSTQRTACRPPSVERSASTPKLTSEVNRKPIHRPIMCLKSHKMQREMVPFHCDKEPCMGARAGRSTSTFRSVGIRMVPATLWQSAFDMCTVHSSNEKARCREEVAAGLISKTVRKEVHRIQRQHHIWEE
ncbi:hypothetical protein SAMN05518861_11632 [Mesorhizobium sp. YR577]|nr:hypothetical protein SAMN05518861_11632 [Mesorhizobium sp. YR577]